MSRPTVSSPAVLEDGLRQLWSDLQVDESDRTSREAICRAFAQEGPILDEEAVADRLVQMGWGWEREEVIEAVENAAGALLLACSRHVEAWVHNTGQVARLSEGDEVSVTRRQHTHTGTVVAIDRRRGTYTIHVPGEGHVPLGALGTQGWVIAFEEAHRHLPGGAVPAPDVFRLVPLAVA